MPHPLRCTLAALALLLAARPAAALVALEAHFDADAEGFVYQDDAFRSTSEPAYASGSYTAGGGFDGGGLRVDLGGIDDADVSGMSGGWQASFDLLAPEPLELRIRYRLTLAPDYESDEYGEVLVSVDGALVGTGANDYVVRIEGDGNGGSADSTGWRLFSADLGTLAAGNHTVSVGGYNNEKTLANESTEILVDDVVIETFVPPVQDPAAAALVNALDLERFRANVELLAAFGSRAWNQQGNLDAIDWLEAELQSYGYANVERHTYTFSGAQRDNVYATKIGSVNPDQMYIVSAHMDSNNTDSPGNGFAPGANDDASGTSLVLELARVFAPPEVQTDVSIRFVLWNNEETGLDGSEAYVADRAGLQGIESPPGSGQYPEPVWLGILQHDMILFDHGLPPQPTQIAAADIDVEYQAAATFGGAAIDLALAVLAANELYADDYPAEVSDDMNNTDSRSFQDDCPAISLRENRRVAEIGNGSNPHWHKDTDVPETFSDLDYLFGFNVAQTTAGAVAELAGATVQCSNGADDDADGLVDFPLDNGCASFADYSEERACADGLDNDGDGAADFPADEGCVDATGPSEDPACSDGADNDGDGSVDWDGAGMAAPDPDCGGLAHRTRETPKPSCGLGAELALGLLALGCLRARRYSST